MALIQLYPNALDADTVQRLTELGIEWAAAAPAPSPPAAIVCSPADVSRFIDTVGAIPITTVADPVLIQTLGRRFVSAVKTDRLRLFVYDPSVQQHLAPMGVRATYLPPNERIPRALFNVLTQPSSYDVITGESLLHRLLWQTRDYTVDAASRTFCLPNNVYFANTNDVAAAFQLAVRSGAPFVLVTHNSDDNVTAAPGSCAMEYLSHPLLKAWYTQNACFRHEKLFCLPIGIANSGWPHGDKAALARAAAPHKTLECYLGSDLKTNRKEREPTLALKTHYEWLNQQLPYDAYLALLARHRFCVCPEGAGVDTHRFWECLYLGVVPIVRRNAADNDWISLWADRVPMVIVDEWNQVCPAFLAAAPTDAASAAKWTRLSTYVDAILAHAQTA